VFNDGSAAVRDPDGWGIFEEDPEAYRKAIEHVEAKGYKRTEAT